MVNINTDKTKKNHSKIPRKNSKKTRRISETKERRSSYTFGFKRCALRHLAMSNNKSLTGRNLGIDRRLLIDWEKLKDQIMDSKYLNSSRKLKNRETARKALHQRSEEMCFAWFTQRRSDYIAVSTEDLRTKMLELVENEPVPVQTNTSTVISTTATTSAAAAATRIEDLNITAANEITNKKFSASIGWCRRFMKRYGLVIRRISGSGRSFKSDTVHTIHEYLIQLRETVKRYSPDEILSMDETSHNMDAVGRNTVSSDVHFCSRSCQRK